MARSLSILGVSGKERELTNSVDQNMQQKFPGVIKKPQTGMEKEEGHAENRPGQDKVNNGLFIRSIDPEVTQPDKRKLCGQVLRESDVNDK